MTTAKELAKGQRAISVAEFFEKNRHLLGFSNRAQSLLTSVKEAVDNSLDACEEVKILPEIKVEISETKRNRYKIIIEDNGPGIVEKQIAPIFGKLLYGSKFQSIGGKQGRGQQGIGISSVVLYAQLTTGKPMTIFSKTSPNSPAHSFKLHINTNTNEPEIVESRIVDWMKDHGTKIEFEIEAKYIESKQSVPEYIKQTAVINPHARIIYKGPNEKQIEYPRVTEKLPKQSKKIRPHPHGVELGVLKRMLRSTNARSLSSFLTKEFDKVGSGTAKEILKNSELDPKILPKLLNGEQMEQLLDGIRATKIMNPSLDCLSPIGSDILKKSVETEYDIDFVHAITRPPSAYRGMPFQIECAIGYGGSLNSEGKAKLMRFANKIPLLYQQGACAISRATSEVNWKSYGLSQSSGSLPQGPVVILIHMASVWVPYTSESKEAIASYSAIMKEIRLAIQECGRSLQRYVSKKKKAESEAAKREKFKGYSAEVAAALSKLTGESAEEIHKQIVEIAELKFSKFETELDELEEKSKIKKEEE